MVAAIQRARTALERIATTWPLVEPAKDATLARRRPEPRAMGRATSASLDTLLRAERGERLTAGRAVVVSAPSPAPLDLAVIDAEQLVVTTLRDLAWLAASTLRDKRLGWPPREWSVPAACDFLTIAVAHVSAPLAADMATQLVTAHNALEAAVGLDLRGEQLWHEGELWVTSKAAARHLDVDPTNVRDWHRRGMVTNRHGADRSFLADGRRWYPLRDLKATKRGLRSEQRKEAS